MKGPDFRSLGRDIRRVLRVPQRPAVLGDVNGTIYDRNNLNSGLVYVRYVTSSGYSTPTLVRGPAGIAIPLTPGRHVKVGYDSDNQLAVLGIDFVATAISSGSPLVGTTFTEPVGENNVNQDDILTLRSFTKSIPSNPSYIVGIASWLVIHSDRTVNLFPGGQVDISSLVPSAGNQRLVVVFVQDDYLTVSATASSQIPLLDVLTIDQIAEAIQLTNPKYTPASAWRLYDGQTYLKKTDKFLDLRQLVNSSIGAGDIIDNILTDENGDVLSDENGNVLVQE